MRLMLACAEFEAQSLHSGNPQQSDKESYHEDKTCHVRLQRKICLANQTHLSEPQFTILPTGSDNPDHRKGLTQPQDVISTETC